MPNRSSRWLLLGSGGLLVALSWSASWSGRSPLAHHAFFPLWLGYILTVLGLTELLTGSSLLRRGPLSFSALFLCSIPFWWVFEVINWRLHDWRYVLPHHYSWFAYHAEATLAFSTVIPAIFATAELWNALVGRILSGRWIALRLPPRGWMAFIGIGVVMLALTLAWPTRFFPLAWISLFFILDPLVHLSGGSGIATRVSIGHWRSVLLLFAAGLTCGWFWEMWNSRASPKWVYQVPHFDRWHVFEMPLLGYGGYLPFALEAYAVVRAIDRLRPFLGANFTRFDDESDDRSSKNRR